jgi:hypothetical protein
MSPLAVVAQTGAITDRAAHMSTTLSTFNQWSVDMNASTQQDDAPSRLNQIVFRETATRTSGIFRRAPWTALPAACPALVTIFVAPWVGPTMHLATVNG